MKNRIRLRKLWPPKVGRVKNSKTNHQTLQRPIFEHPKTSLYVVLVIKVQR